MNWTPDFSLSKALVELMRLIFAPSDNDEREAEIRQQITDVMNRIGRHPLMKRVDVAEIFGDFNTHCHIINGAARVLEDNIQGHSKLLELTVTIAEKQIEHRIMTTQEVTKVKSPDEFFDLIHRTDQFYPKQIALLEAASNNAFLGIVAPLMTHFALLAKIELLSDEHAMSKKAVKVFDDMQEYMKGREQ